MPKYRVRLRSTEWYEFEVEGADLSSVVAGAIDDFNYEPNPKRVGNEQYLELVEELKAVPQKTLCSDDEEMHKFYSDYIKDNGALAEMPVYCWTFVHDHLGEVYDEFKQVMSPAFGHTDEWYATETAIRVVLRKHHIDMGDW